MSLDSVEEAEVVAQDWLNNKYSNRIGRTSFNQVVLENGIWTLRADVQFRGVLSPAPKIVLLKVDSLTTKVVSFLEQQRQK